MNSVKKLPLSNLEDRKGEVEVIVEFDGVDE